jgi:hypothetical protein
MNIERIIGSIEARGHNLYREDSEAADRLAWEVGALRSKLRELANDILTKQVDEKAKREHEGNQ